MGNKSSDGTFEWRAVCILPYPELPVTSDYSSV